MNNDNECGYDLSYCRPNQNKDGDVKIKGMLAIGVFKPQAEAPIISGPGQVTPLKTNRNLPNR